LSNLPWQPYGEHAFAMSTLLGIDPQELHIPPVPPSGAQAGASGPASVPPLVLPLVEPLPLLLPLAEPVLPLVEPLVLPLAEPEPPSMFGLELLLSSLLQAPVAAEAATSARTTPPSFKKRRFAFITQPRNSQNGT
jgi:hypothetical protein